MMEIFLVQKPYTFPIFNIEQQITCMSVRLIGGPDKTILDRSSIFILNCRPFNFSSGDVIADVVPHVLGRLC